MKRLKLVRKTLAVELSKRRAAFCSSSPVFRQSRCKSVACQLTQRGSPETLAECSLRGSHVKPS